MTTIPAAAAISLAAAYQDSDALTGSIAQLAVNLVMILAAGVATLFIQRRLYERRHREHVREGSRRAAGLTGKSARNAPPEREPV